MRKSITNLLLAVLLTTLIVGALVYADPITQIVGQASLDNSTTPGTWRHIPATNVTQTATALVPTTTAATNLTTNASLLLACHDSPVPVFGCASWDRLEILHFNTDANPVVSHGLATAGHLYVSNGGQWDRVRALTAIDTTELGMIAFGNLLAIDGAVRWSRQSGVSVDRLTASISGGIGQVSSSALTVPLSTWSATSTPAANTQATATRAAGAAGTRNVSSTISACFSGTAVAAPVQINLRDGASGVGTILWSALLGVPTINSGTCVNFSATFTGSDATAMTLEFAAAGGASTNETVTLTGFSVR